MTLWFSQPSLGLPSKVFLAVHDLYDGLLTAY